MNLNRPYLIIPKLIIQPTWGGDYIAKLKNWNDLPYLTNQKVGQSYELFSDSKLAISIIDTSDPKFVPEIGNPDNSEIDTKNFTLKEGTDYIKIFESGNLLIKINQSKGNSFQLHLKHGLTDSKWQPKAESWYYLEDGYLTFGIKKGIDINDYKNCCLRINDYMSNLSTKIKNGEIGLEKARNDAKVYIEKENPWQYVNVYESKKYEVIDPSIGGIHHSWEENNQKFPLGNIVYEIQEDAMDPVCTIRSFDQGKIKDDGTIRNLNIEDYFKYLDTDEIHNDVSMGNHKDLKTDIYTMEVVEINGQIENETNGKFNHIFVRDGKIEVVTPEVTLKIGKGHSCYIPKELKNYIIRTVDGSSVVLKTFLT